MVLTTFDITKKNVAAATGSWGYSSSGKKVKPTSHLHAVVCDKVPDIHLCKPQTQTPEQRRWFVHAIRTTVHDG